jgi:DNA-binding XRE family transcriptional regulator
MTMEKQKSIEEFSSALREWRKRMGMTQVQAADALRVNKMSIYCWETERQSCALAKSLMLLMELIEQDMVAF